MCRGDNYLYLCGDFTDTLWVNKQAIIGQTKRYDNGYVAKYSPTLELLWFKQYSFGGNIYVSSVAIDKHKTCYITGECTNPVIDKNGYVLHNSNGFTAQLDSNGNELMFYKLTGRDELRLRDIALSNDEHPEIIGAGSIVKNASPRGGPETANKDALLIKFDPAILKRNFTAPKSAGFGKSIKQYLFFGS